PGLVAHRHAPFGVVVLGEQRVAGRPGGPLRLVPLHPFRSRVIGLVVRHGAPFAWKSASQIRRPFEEDSDDLWITPGRPFPELRERISPCPPPPSLPPPILCVPDRSR